jgi:hypothetical protein
MFSQSSVQNILEKRLLALKWLGIQTLLCLVIFMTVFQFHLKNQWLPTWDAGGYLETALNIKDTFNQGFFNGFTHIVFERHEYRPTSWSNISAIFLLVFSYRLNITMGIIQSLSIYLLACSAYGISRLFTTRFKSIVISGVLITAPWLHEYTREYFYAEPLWLAMSTTWLFFSLKPGFRLSNFLVAILCSSIAFSLRPVEFLVSTLIFALFFGWRDFQQKGFSFLRYTLIRNAAVVLLALCCIVPLLQGIVSSTLNVFLSVFLFFCFLFAALAGMRRVNRSKLNAYISGIYLGLVWYLPKVLDAFNWIYASSYGSWAKDSNLTYLKEPWWFPVSKEIQYYAPRISLSIILVPCFILILKAIRPRYFRHFSGNLYKCRNDSPTTLFFVSLLSIIPMLLALITSRTADPRKIMLSVFILLLFSLIVTLSFLPSLFASLIIFALTFLFLLQLTYVTLVNLSPQQGPSTGTRAGSFTSKYASEISFLYSNFGIVRPPVDGEDPNRIVARWLRDIIPASSKLAVYSHGVLATGTYTSNSILMIDTKGLRLASLEIGHDILFDRPVEFEVDNNLETFLETARSQGFNYLLLDRFAGPIGPEVKRTLGLFKRVSMLIAASDDVQLKSRQVQCRFLIGTEFCLFQI